MMTWVGPNRSDNRTESDGSLWPDPRRVAAGRTGGSSEVRNRLHDVLLLTGIR